MLRKVKMVFVTAFYNFRMWRGNVRIASTFILAFILCFLLTDKLMGFAAEQGTSMQAVEAFVWTFGDSNSILLSSLLLLLLFGDVPFITTATPFFLIRENRKIWVMGQLVYIIFAAAIYLLFILLSTCLLCAKYSFPKNTWSQTAAILAYSDKGEEIALPAAVKTLEMGRPYQTMGYIFLLMMLYTLVMVFILLLITVWKGQAAGVAGVLLFSAYGMLLNPENIQKLLHLPDVLYYKARVWVGWVSPLNHATYYMHDFGYDDLPTLRQTGGIFTGLLLILIFLSMKVMKHYGFQFKGTEN